MEYPIKVQDINLSTEFYDEVMPLIKKSKEYLSSHKWCRSIKQCWLFVNLGYALNIYLYQIENEQSPEDDLIWIMTGDLPSIYLDTFGVKTTKEVIENYIDLANDWIEHAEVVQSLDECFPFDIDISTESIESFKKRIKLLSENILQNISDIGYDVIF